MPLSFVIIFEALPAFAADFAAAVGGLAGGCAAAAFVAGVAGLVPLVVGWVGGVEAVATAGLGFAGGSVTAGVFAGTAGFTDDAPALAGVMLDGGVVLGAATLFTAFEAALSPACVAREIANRAKGLLILRSSGSASNSSSS